MTVLEKFHKAAPSSESTSRVIPFGRRASGKPMTKMSWSLCRDPCSQLLGAGDSDLWLNSYMKVGGEFFKLARFLVKVALGM